MKRKHLAALAVLVPALCLGATASAADVVLSAAVTSAAAGSANAVCLLDPICVGSWASGAADNGADDGLYLQFEKPVAIDFVKVVTESSETSVNAWNFELYLNGSTRNKRGLYQAVEPPAPLEPGAFLFGVVGNSDPSSNAIKENVRSAFLKLNPNEAWKPGENKIKKIVFLKQDATGALQPIALTLPKIAPASVTASSVLEPVSAYHPANLFDSRYDFAWATDGKKTVGKNESVTLSLNAPQNVAGLLVWNGYQRSPEHFKANGRVTSLEVKADTLPPQTVKLADTMDPQKITLNPPLANARQITLTIRDIAPGTSYKDVLLSELRLIGGSGEFILPQVELPKVAAPAAFAGLVDRSFASLLHQPIFGDLTVLDGPDYVLSKRCDNARLRLRGNGTFVVYKDFNYGKADSAAKPANINANVMEGNWEPKGDKIRIFGRKYVTTLQQSEYLAGAAPAASRTEIFQSEVTAKPYGSLTPAEKTALFAALWQKKKGPDAKAQKFLWAFGKAGALKQVEAANYDELTKKMDAELTALNPYYVSSSVLNDLFAPAASVDACVSP